MARRRRSSLALSAEQARQALTVLVQEGKLAASEVRKALGRRDRLVRALRASLAALGEDVGKLARTAGKVASLPVLAGIATTAKRRAARRAKPRISAATRKMYQAQGRYLAALRPLSKAARVKIKAIREKSGVNAAIATAKRMKA
jgi:predicted RNA-binding protein YlqC (UPF0109 family)